MIFLFSARAEPISITLFLISNACALVIQSLLSWITSTFRIIFSVLMMSPLFTPICKLLFPLMFCSIDARREVAYLSGKSIIVLGLEEYLNFATDELEKDPILYKRLVDEAYKNEHKIIYNYQ